MLESFTNDYDKVTSIKDFRDFIQGIFPLFQPGRQLLYFKLEGYEKVAANCA